MKIKTIIQNDFSPILDSAKCEKIILFFGEKFYNIRCTLHSNKFTYTITPVTPQPSHSYYDHHIGV